MTFADGPPPPVPGVPPPLFTPAPERSGMRTRTKVLLVVGVGLLALVGVAAVLVGLSFGANTLYQSVVEENVPGDAWFGECYGDDGSKTIVDCNGPHVFEVVEIMVFDLEADPSYPSWYDRSLGFDLCEDALTSLTNEGYLLGSHDYVALFPSEEEWEQGNSWVPCVAFADDLGTVNEPLGG